MPKKKETIPEYGTVELKGITYYRTRIILHHDTIHLARIRCACVDGNHMRAVVRREIGIGAKCRTFSLIF